MAINNTLYDAANTLGRAFLTKVGKNTGVAHSTLEVAQERRSG